MDLQYVEAGQYYELLVKEGFEFIRCRPVKVRSGEHPKVVYENPETGQVVEREFDLVVLSEGIHPPKDAEQIFELCALGVDEKGFLRSIRDGSKTGIYIAGCACGPKRIEETYTESLTVARQVLADMAQIR
jgi:heterodisulfide reductase subunit A